MSSVPSWVNEYLAEWMDRLRLREWVVRVKTSPHPSDDASGSVKAVINVYPDVRTAELEIRDTVSEDPTDDWKVTLIHELLHVRFGSTTDFVERVLFPAMSPQAAEVAQTAFVREVESAVEMTAQAFFELTNANNNS